VRGTKVEKNWREGNLLAMIFGLQEMRPAGYSSVDLPFLVINSLGEYRSIQCGESPVVFKEVLQPLD